MIAITNKLLLPSAIFFISGLMAGWYGSEDLAHPGYHVWTISGPAHNFLANFQELWHTEPDWLGAAPDYIDPRLQ